MTSQHHTTDIGRCENVPLISGVSKLAASQTGEEDTRGAEQLPPLYQRQGPRQYDRHRHCSATHRTPPPGQRRPPRLSSAARPPTAPPPRPRPTAAQRPTPPHVPPDRYHSATAPHVPARRRSATAPPPHRMPPAQPSGIHIDLHPPPPPPHRTPPPNDHHRPSALTARDTVESRG